METPVEVLPPVNPVVARGVLIEIDSLIEWQKSAVSKAEKAGIRLARLIASAAENQYWTTRGINSEKEYIQKTFPHSESQYYILKRVGGTLRMYPAAVLEEIGVSKCQDLVRIHNHCGDIGANWFIWAKTESRDAFRKRVRTYLCKALPAPKKDDDQFVGFKVWSSAVPVVNNALAVAANESGSESKSNNFILICAEFLAGHNEDGDRITNGNMALGVIKSAIMSMKKLIKTDPVLLERLIGVIRSSLENIKEDDGSHQNQED